MRKCSNCFQLKPDTAFYRRRAYGPSGRQSRCKVCNAEVVRSYERRKRLHRIRARWDRVYGRSA